jgi:TolA-binding protein
MMKKVIFLSLFTGFLFAETSAFEAGNLDSPNPYGLTQDEKHILQNREDIKNLKELVVSQTKLLKKQQTEINRLKLKLLNYKMTLDLLKQKMAGVETLLPQFEKNGVDLEKLKKEFNQTQMATLNLEEVVKANQLREQNNTQRIINLIETLAQNLDKLENKFNSFKNKKDDFKSLSKYKMFDKAISYFRKSEFSKAKEIFSYLYEKNYKPATTLFYLGEIEYKRGHFKNALAFYKNSIQKYPKNTFFTAELLYHTGYSLQKIGQKEAAKKSYLKIVNDFPDSIFVKYAKKRIESLEKSK